MNADGISNRGGVLRGPQDVAAGVFVIVLASIALWSLGSIRVASYIAISPAMFPRGCAYLIVLGGLALILRGLVRPGPPLTGLVPRPVLLVTAAIVVFGIVAPVFGFVPAGILTMLLGGAASRDVKPIELLLVTLALAGFSWLLFVVLLKLPMPAVILPGFWS